MFENTKKMVAAGFCASSVTVYLNACCKSGDNNNNNNGDNYTDAGLQTLLSGSYKVKPDAGKNLKIWIDAYVKNPDGTYTTEKGNFEGTLDETNKDVKKQWLVKVGNKVTFEENFVAKDHPKADIAIEFGAVSGASSSPAKPTVGKITPGSQSATS